MRTIMILTLASVTTAIVTYGFMKNETVSQPAQSTASQLRTHTDLAARETLERLSDELLAYQNNYQEQQRQRQEEQARLNTMFLQLEERLNSLETGEANLEGKDASGVDSAEQTVEPEEPEKTYSDAANSNSKKLSEHDFGHWIDKSLDTGDVDDYSTALALEQTTLSLAKARNINLENMQCRERYCRAVFSGVNGNQPDIGELFGEPPFLNEGFTLLKPDGRVAVYFTQPGVSLTQLRDEAQLP